MAKQTLHNLYINTSTHTNKEREIERDRERETHTLQIVQEYLEEPANDNRSCFFFFF